MKNLFSVYNKDTRMTSMTQFCSGVFFNFEQISYIVMLLLLLNLNMGMTIGKDNIIMLATITVQALPPNESTKMKQQEISSKSTLKVKLKMV